jgi:hypothetical protein
MSLKTHRIAPTPKEKFIKGLIMAMHSETLILSESERSLYRFILDYKDNLNSLIRGRPRKMWWRIW